MVAAAAAGEATNMAFQKPMSKAKIRSSRMARRNREAGEAYEARMAPEREKAKRRKATRKAQKRKAFAKLVAAEVLKHLTNAGHI